MRRAQAGMSLVEMLVALALSLVVLLLGATLLVDLLERMKRASDDSAAGSITDAALALWARDVRSAVDLPSRDGDLRADSDVLLLVGPAGERVAWFRRGDSVVRRFAVVGGEDREVVLARECDVLDFATEPPALVRITIRRGDESLRERVVLARNAAAARGPSP